MELIFYSISATAILSLGFVLTEVVINVFCYMNPKFNNFWESLFENLPEWED